MPGDLPTPTRYVVTFEYFVNSQRYVGKTSRSTPVPKGHHFEISYDPNNPSRNTGSDLATRWIWWVVGIGVAAAIAYLKHRYR